MHRVEVINLLIEKYFPDDCKYLEIGVRNPADCFDHIRATSKTSVDPGTEQDKPNATFIGTSDEFFNQLDTSDSFNIIFIDGLHLADQVYRDILNSVAHITRPGFVLLHDVNPPHWSRAHSDYDEYLRHGGLWNGTVWKAFYRARTVLPLRTYTIDTDEGIGVIESHNRSEQLKNENCWYEYGEMAKDRSKSLGLISIEEFKNSLM